MNCKNCQCEISQGKKFCANCGTEIDGMQIASQNQQVIKLHSLEELTSFLDNKSQTYKGALAKVLASQLEVLRSVQSPELSSLTFDLLLDNLHMALQACESKIEETEVQQKFSLMINAYIFFSQAKIEAASAANKREADALLATGANIMAKSVTAVVQYAITQSVNPNAIIEISNDIFGSSDGTPNFVVQLINWWRKDVRIKESRQTFIATVDMLIDKLNDDRELIGPSRILHGFVKQYAPKLISIKMTPLHTERDRMSAACYNRAENITETNRKLVPALLWVLGVNAVIYAVLFVIWLLTCWVSFITDWSAGDWVADYNYIAIGSIALYCAVAIVMLIINSFRQLIIKSSTKSLLKKIDNEIDTSKNNLNNHYSSILEYFKNN